MFAASSLHGSAHVEPSGGPSLERPQGCMSLARENPVRRSRGQLTVPVKRSHDRRTTVVAGRNASW